MGRLMVWHDETERWERTGRLDEGPCWCALCISDELEEEWSWDD